MRRQNLWAPWRVEFVKKPRTNVCIFCRTARQRKDDDNFVLARWTKSFAMLNLFPYNNGHTMIAPYRHLKEPMDLDAEEATDLWKGVCRVMNALKEIYSPLGFNVGANVGRSSGAGFEHFHIHVVPRWAGDTNFMPVLADVKVIPEHLRLTYESLRSAI